MLRRDFELAETFYFGGLTEIESETKLTTMNAGLVGLIIVGSRSYTLDHVRSRCKSGSQNGNGSRSIIHGLGPFTSLNKEFDPIKERCFVHHIPCM